MKSIPLALALAAAVLPALAGETPWQEAMPGVDMRLISTDVLTPHGTVWVAVEIDMPGDVKTYWRVPGESGIPPRFDFSGSVGIGGHEVAWPFPRRETDAGYLDHAYYGHTVLPIELEVQGDDPRIVLAATLGICSEVCVPIAAEFALELDFAAPDRANVLRMQQARARVPIPLEGPEPLGAVRFELGEEALFVEAVAPGFPSATAIADIAGRMLLFGPPEPASQGAALRFPLLGKARTDLSEGDAVHITFMGADGPYEIVRPLRLGGG